MKRAATPGEINKAFENMREILGRPLTLEEIAKLDADMARVIERDDEPGPPPSMRGRFPDHGKPRKPVKS